MVTLGAGTDEHGEKIALAAEKRGLSPQQHCDGVAEEYKDLWKKVQYCTGSTREKVQYCTRVQGPLEKGTVLHEEYKDLWN